MLCQEPLQRIGAGIDGSSNDYNSLKDHPFLDEFDYERVLTEKPPYIPPKKLLPSLSKV